MNGKENQDGAWGEWSVRLSRNPEGFRIGFRRITWLGIYLAFLGNYVLTITKPVLGLLQ